MRRLLGIMGWALACLGGCIESDPPQFSCINGFCPVCRVDEDCPQIDGAPLACVGGECAPVDVCAAGIFVADALPIRRDENGEFPPNSLVRQVSGPATGVTLAGGELILNQAGAPRLFEIDFLAPETNERGLYTEARMTLGENSQACTAVLSLWPTRRKQIKICLGGGRIGLATPDGGSSSLVDAALVDLEQPHTYRLSYLPVGARLDEDGRELPETFSISLAIDDQVVVQGIALEDLPDAPAPADRAPLLGFGSEAPGRVAIDFVRWGCNTEAGPCLPARQDDDQACRTERTPVGNCNGDAVADERCDGLDNDCDGTIDENFRDNSSDGRPIGFSDFGETVYLYENCGLTGQCANAVVVCSEDGLSLRCDTEGLSADEICDGQDNDCDGAFDEDFGPQSQNPDLLYLDPLTMERRPLGAPCGTGMCADGVVICQNTVPACSTAGNQAPNEICGNAIDDDCDGQVDEGFDLDGDGFQNCARCLNENCAVPHDCVDDGPDAAEIFPGAAEICNNRDNDCDGQADEGLDRDGDGFTPCQGDCNDDPTNDVEGLPGAADIHPEAEEVCDTVDNDCDERIDEGFAFSQADGLLRYAQSANCGRCGNDCAAVGAEYNTLGACIELFGDFRCNATCAPGFRDLDGDLRAPEQFWNDETTGCECRVRVETTCDSGTLQRACSELCNGIDDDCDGETDEAEDIDLSPCWPGRPAQRGVGICRDGASVCEGGEISNRCVGAVLPEADQETTCDGRDEDCDGLVDEGDALLDATGQIRAGDLCDTGQAGACVSGVRRCMGGEMRCVPVAGGQPEVCDGNDNDCDGVVDEDTDFDGDGAPRCRPCRRGEQPNAEGYCVFDCNDTLGVGENFSPLSNEICTGEDNDCDGKIDEDFVLVGVDGHPVDLNGQRAVDAAQLVYNQVDNCGGCGLTCSRPNGLTTCDGGTCTLIGCRPGFLDEDGNPDNGCEQSDCRPDNVGQAAFDSINAECSKPMYDDGSACGCRGLNRCVRRGGVPAVVCVIDDGNPDEGAIVGPAECPPDRRINAQAELCDALDNDCDGQPDEDFVERENGRPVLDDDGDLIYAAVEHCGGCGVICERPNGLTSCDGGTCALIGCVLGFADADGDPANGCERAQ